jgi:hypothetical protein
MIGGSLSEPSPTLQSLDAQREKIGRFQLGHKAVRDGGNKWPSAALR